jgi:hypothetical protein
MKVTINTRIILSPIFASLFIFNLLAEIDNRPLSIWERVRVRADCLLYLASN